jgi:hypothetical protein
MKFRATLALASVSLSLTLVACASADPKPSQAPIDDQRRTVTSVEIAEFEVSEFGADRFTHCPPPGELGQAWIPQIPTWIPTATPPAKADTPEKAARADGGSATFGISASDIPPPGSNGPTVMGADARAERVIEVSRQAFRHCYNRGKLYDPTQDGHVAIVLRIAKDGRVARSEAYGACDLSTEVIRCMMDTASDLRFDAPQPGEETVTVPVVFHPTGGRNRRPNPNDVYTAEAYLAVEAGRPAFHACEEKARKGGKSVVASATFALDLDEKGGIAHAHVDPWSGDQDLLKCAVDAMDKVRFPVPPAGRGHVTVRLAFNPRPGTK